MTGAVLLNNEKLDCGRSSDKFCFENSRVLDITDANYMLCARALLRFSESLKGFRRSPVK